ncbi:MAG: copper homeostasis protein CutC [Pirellulaceae bacterium]|nr:copper homeostasis protein CutC [Pirellulaceae bacterium]
MPSLENRPIIEVAVADVDDAVAAQKCGADRLELNSAMPLGGLTPSIGLVREVLAAVQIPVVVMVRPRPGGFCYSPSQFKTALLDAETILAAGAAGIVWGALDPDRNVDQPRVAAMKALVAGKELVFHRAFDLAQDWSMALESLIDSGVDRVLSSGQQPAADSGVDCLKAMMQQARQRIEVIVGSGVRVATIPLFHAAGLCQFHGTFSQSGTDPGYDSAAFRFAVNDQQRCLDQAELRAARTLVDRLDG